jgi:beta-1,2-mannobiose phosphorylase / 1,2-beta-oligomannan phosphorylase
MGQETDYLIFRPDDVDLARSPLRRSIAEETHVMGAFNPGLARLPNGNLLLMVRVAEALKEPVAGRCVRVIRWTPQGYVLDRHSLDSINMTDPRQFSLKHGTHRLLALTSHSWLLPVELTPDGREIVRVHYDRAIEPAAPYQEMASRMRGSPGSTASGI